MCRLGRQDDEESWHRVFVQLVVLDQNGLNSALDDRQSVEGLLLHVHHGMLHPQHLLLQSPILGHRNLQTFKMVPKIIPDGVRVFNLSCLNVLQERFIEVNGLSVL